MIDLKTGKILFDEPPIVIHPECTLSEFLRCRPSLKLEQHNAVTGFTTLGFTGKLDGLTAWFLVLFRGEQLHYLNFGKVVGEPSTGEDEREVERAIKRSHDEWLLSVTGQPPPYEFAWGEIRSGFDLHRETAGMVIRFRQSFLDAGISDLNEFFESRRAQIDALRKSAGLSDVR